MRIPVAVAITLVLPAALSAQNRPSNSMQTRSAEVYLERARNAANPADRTELVKQALATLLKGADRDGNNPKLWLLTGQAYAQLGDLAGADSAFDKALALYPDYKKDIEPQQQELFARAYNAAVAAVRENRVEEAIASLESADRIYRARPDALVLLGTLHARRGDHTAAERAFRGALEITRGPAAQALAGDAQKQFKEQQTVATQQLAQILIAQGKSEEAAQLTRELAETNPSDVRARLQLAASLSHSGKMAEATKIYGEVLAQPDLDAAELFDIGVELYQAEQFDQAAVAFRRAAQAKPHNRDVLYNLGQALYAVSGKKEAARKAASGSEAESMTRDLVRTSEELNEVAERLREMDPNNRNALVMAANAQRLLGDLATGAAQQPWKTKMLGTLQAVEALTVEVSDIRATVEPSQVRVNGRLTNVKAAPGTQITLEFTFLDATGAAIGTARTTVAAPDAGGSAPFSLQASVSKPVEGWSYRVVS